MRERADVPLLARPPAARPPALPQQPREAPPGDPAADAQGLEPLAGPDREVPQARQGRADPGRPVGPGDRREYVALLITASVVSDRSGRGADVARAALRPALLQRARSSSPRSARTRPSRPSTPSSLRLRRSVAPRPACAAHSQSHPTLTSPPPPPNLPLPSHAPPGPPARAPQEDDVRRHVDHLPDDGRPDRAPRVQAARPPLPQLPRVWRARRR